MDNERLTIELLHIIKEQARRWFIAFIVCLAALFASNIAWLYAWNLPTEESAIAVEADDNSNASYIHGTGDIINGGDNQGEDGKAQDIKQENSSKAP